MLLHRADRGDHRRDRVCTARKFGRYTYAIGSNEEAAKRVGIKVGRHLIAVYAMSGLLAGFGAIMYLSQFGTTTIAGPVLTNLNVIAAVVIGAPPSSVVKAPCSGPWSACSFRQSCVAGFVIIGVHPYWQGVAVGAVLIAAVYVDQTRRAAAQRGSKK